jgi:hypothetical protein
MRGISIPLSDGSCQLSRTGRNRTRGATRLRAQARKIAVSQSCCLFEPWRISTQGTAEGYKICAISTLDFQTIPQRCQDNWMGPLSGQSPGRIGAYCSQNLTLRPRPPHHATRLSPRWVRLSRSCCNADWSFATPHVDERELKVVATSTGSGSSACRREGAGRSKGSSCSRRSPERTSRLRTGGSSRTPVLATCTLGIG